MAYASMAMVPLRNSAPAVNLHAPGPLQPQVASKRPQWGARRRAGHSCSTCRGAAASTLASAAVLAVRGWRFGRRRVQVQQRPLESPDIGNQLLPELDDVETVDAIRTFNKPSSCSAQVLRQISGELAPELINGFSTGWEALDEYYRVVPGEVTVVTGVPGSGKSEWLLSLAANLANQNFRTAVCSFEHQVQDLVLTFLEKVHKQSRNDLPSEDESLKYGFVKDHFPIISSSFEEMSIDRILSDAEGLSEKLRCEGLRLNGLIIDPYNYIDRSDARQRETLYVSDLMTRLKCFAAKHGCHVWLVAHPAKRNAWKDATRPGLYDISGSANFYNKCDMGIVVNRVREDSAVEICVDKARNGEAGKCGSIRLQFDCASRCYK